MAAGRLPAPGTELGPCTGGCSHKDCACNRAMAQAACAVCNKRIGYGVLFYVTGTPPPSGSQGVVSQWDKQLTHYDCAHRKIDCRVCGGMGGKSVGESGPCPACNGEGTVKRQPLSRKRK